MIRGREQLWLALTLLASCLACLGLSAAQTPRGADLLEALEQRYNRLRTLEARFIQRYSLGRVTQVESGRVYFQKPGKMRWEYESPEEKVFLADGRHVYLYVPSEQQVSRSPMSESADWRVPFAWLLGRVDFSELFARLEIKPIERAGQSPLTQVRGLPKSARQGFTEMWFDVNAQRQVERIEIRQPDGALMEFHFRDWRENHSLPRRLFELRVPPGTTWLEVPVAP